MNIPPKGTPLRHVPTGKIYYSTGTTNNLDRLYCDSSSKATKQEYMFPLESLQCIKRRKNMNFKMDWKVPETIEMFDGRPDRETVIALDDILNLRIALATAKTLEEFLLLV